MSTSASSLSPLATRASASGDPAALLKDTLRRSALNLPSFAARKNGATLASNGRSKVKWIATDGAASLGRTDIACNERGKRDRESQQATEGCRLNPDIDCAGSALLWFRDARGAGCGQSLRANMNGG